VRTRLFASLSLGALVGAALVALSVTPSSAFTLSTPSAKAPFSAAQIDKVWYHRQCWVGYYGHVHCRYW
jgi:hypothetical protein